VPCPIGTTAVLAPDGTAPSRARYSNFLVKKDGQWLLASVREAAYVPPSNYENLRELEWVMLFCEFYGIGQGSGRIKSLLTTSFTLTGL